MATRSVVLTVPLGQEQIDVKGFFRVAVAISSYAKVQDVYNELILAHSEESPCIGSYLQLACVG